MPPLRALLPVAALALATLAPAALADDGPQAATSGTGRRAGPPQAGASSRVGPAIEGVVLRVHDGDSFTMRADDGRRLRVRVSGIDAPERGQPFGDAARRALVAALGAPRLRIEPAKTDRYGRTVARVTVPGAGDAGAPRDVGLELVAAGLAWHFARYAADQPPGDAAAYAAAERDARARRAGLWHAASPEPPWAFRSRSSRDEGAPERPRPPAREG